MQRIAVVYFKASVVIVQKINFELNLFPFFPIHAFMCSYKIEYSVLAYLYNY